MKEIIRIIEEGGYPVKWKSSIALNTNNGILNKDVVIKARKRFLGESIGVWAEELVDTKQHYPHNDISEVDFDMDITIMKTSDFNKLVKFYEQFLKD